MKRQRAMPWTVTRCASNGEEVRRKLEASAGKQDFKPRKGTSVSAPGKAAVERLLIKVDGVYTQRPGGLFGPKLEIDYNHFRSCGYTRPALKTSGTARTFKPGCNDRAISISTAVAYSALREALPNSSIGDGDLGENLIVDGVPSYEAGAESGFAEGTRLRLGEKVVVELTEANMPCCARQPHLPNPRAHAPCMPSRSLIDTRVQGYPLSNQRSNPVLADRMQYVPWHAAALERWPREDGKWWRHAECPLSKPGGRGWLGKVLVPGEVTNGDVVLLGGD